MLKRECRNCWYFDKIKVLKYKCNTSVECPGNASGKLESVWLPKENWDAAKGRGSDHDIEKTTKPFNNLILSTPITPTQAFPKTYKTLEEAINNLDSYEDFVIGECGNCLASWTAFTKLWGETDEECGCSEDMKKYYNSSD